MQFLFLMLMIGFLPVQADTCQTPEDCGIAPQAIPDFTLSDVNPHSSTFGVDRSRDEFLGNVLVMYFSQAT
jgi:hypothetical protein